MRAKKKIKIGECTTLKKGATNTNHPSPLSLLLNCPFFSEKSDPNLCLDWEAKVEQTFNVYEVQEDQKVRLASLEFLDYVMQW